MAEGGGSPAAGTSGRETRGSFGGLGKAWKAMNAWGDEFERKHFNGDLLHTVGSAPRKTVQAMNEWGDDFERRHFDGDLIGAIDRTLAGAALDVLPAALAAEGLQIDPALTGAWADITGGAALEPAAAAPSGSPSAASRDERQSASSSSSSRPQPEVPAQQWPSAVDLWEEAQRLQQQLAEHRGLRQERSARRRDADVELHPLRAALIQEQSALLADRSAREAAGERRNSVQHEADVLRAQHHLSLSRQARLEAEAQHHTAEERRAKQAETDWTMDEGCGGDREWARDGPETDALKDAKLALAEVLGEVDEVRLLCRRELHALQEAVAVADGENAKLRRSEEEFVPEKSLFSSVKLLFNIARGREGAG